MDVMRRIFSQRHAAKVMLVSVLLMLLVSVSACSCSKASGTSVSLYLADRNVTTGETFVLEVRLKTDTPCRGAQCALSFDPALMRCDNVTEGSFFKEWASANGASTMVVPQATIDNAQGQVSTTGVAIIGEAGGGGPKGNGVLFRYYFTALGNGKAEPTLSDVVVSNATGQAIPGVKVNN